MIRGEEAANARVMEMARRSKLPLIATNGVRFTHPQKRPLMDVLTCTRHKTNVMETGRLLEQNSERYIKSPAAMRRLFADMPEAIGNALELSARLQFTLADLGYEFPRYPVPAGETMDSYLRARDDEGSAGCGYGAHIHDKAYRQIEHELALIQKLKLPGYFLIVWDIVDYCRKQGILVQGQRLEQRTARSAIRWELPPSIRSKWSCCSSDFLSDERGGE